MRCVVKQQFALKKFSVCRDFSFATMGCTNSVEVCSSGEIKVNLHHIGQEPKMVKKMMKTVTFDPDQMQLCEVKTKRQKNRLSLTPEESLLQAYLNMIRINPTILEQKVEEKRLRDFR